MVVLNQRLVAGVRVEAPHTNRSLNQAAAQKFHVKTLGNSHDCIPSNSKLQTKLQNPTQTRPSSACSKFSPQYISSCPRHAQCQSVCLSASFETWIKLHCNAWVAQVVWDALSRVVSFCFTGDPEWLFSYCGIGLSEKIASVTLQCTTGDCWTHRALVPIWFG